MGTFAQDEGDYKQAREFYQQSLDINQKLGDQSGIADTLAQLGILALSQGNKDEARQLFQQALEIFERLKSPYVALAREYLSDLDEQAEPQGG